MKSSTFGLAVACEPQTHFRSSLLSFRKIAIFRRERSDDRKCVCGSQASLAGVRKWNRQRAVFISLGVRDHRSHVRHLSSRMRKESQENGTLILYLCRCGVQTTDVGLRANSPFHGVQRSHVWAARQPRTP